MPTPKKSVPIPTSSRKVAKGALMIAVTVLQDERVREQLRKAPGAARDWAAQRQQARADVIDVDSSEVGAPRPRPAPASIRTRLDPTQRFGQKGIERRIAALQRNVDLVFPDPTDESGDVTRRAVDELSRAVAISATMPVNDRRRARSRIDAELTRLENALVDAVLPPD